MSLTAPSDPPAPADPAAASAALFVVEPTESTRPGPTRRARAAGSPPPVADLDPGHQLSLFGVEAVEPSPADLAGLLAGPGQIVRMGGTARVSVVVDAAWRVHVLVAELARRGLAASWVTTAEEQYAVRTSYTTALAALGRDWTRGPGKLPPDLFHLDGPRLRLWAAAAGDPAPAGGGPAPAGSDSAPPGGEPAREDGGVPQGDSRAPGDSSGPGGGSDRVGGSRRVGGSDPGVSFLLRLGPGPGDCWPRVGAALAAIGLAAELVGPADGGPAYRITGRRRLARLAELVGERPPAAPPAGWPGPDLAPAPPRPAAPDGPADPAARNAPTGSAASDDPEAGRDPATVGRPADPGADEPAAPDDLDAEAADAADWDDPADPEPPWDADE